MSEPLTCLACGQQDHDVIMRMVEVEPAEQRVVQAAIPTAEDQRGVKGFEYVDVRERYISEPRCRDKSACRARLAALAPVPPVEPAVAEDDSWLL